MRVDEIWFSYIPLQNLNILCAHKVFSFLYTNGLYENGLFGHTKIKKKYISNNMLLFVSDKMCGLCWIKFILKTQWSINLSDKQACTESIERQTSWTLGSDVKPWNDAETPWPRLDWTFRRNAHKANNFVPAHHVFLA